MTTDRRGVRRAAAAAAEADATASALAALGLQRGEAVRFRRPDRARWQLGTVHRLERDGSVRVTDAEGSARTVPLAGLEVRVRRGPRRAAAWEPLSERCGRVVQLALPL